MTAARALDAIGVYLRPRLLLILVLGFAIQEVERSTGVILDLWAWHPVLLWGPLGMLGLGALAGVVPAIKAYATDVAKTLSRSAA